MEFQRKVEQHERCVDKQLAANGCQRIKVKKDGDCFFTAVCMQLDSASTITPEVLRQKVSSHLLQYEEKYSQFLTQNDKIKYRYHARKIASLGVWASEVGDLVPLAAADVLKRTLNIFSSCWKTCKQITPEEHVTPTASKSISLAHITVNNIEHYDCVTRQHWSSSYSGE